MDDALPPVDLDRRPVALHGGDLAAGDAPQQTGAVQLIQRARWLTSEQGQRVPAIVALSFVLHAPNDTTAARDTQQTDQAILAH